MRELLLTGQAVLRMWGDDSTPLAELNKVATSLSLGQFREKIRRYTPPELGRLRKALLNAPKSTPREAPYLFLINSSKGGVGKTTFTGNLGVLFSCMGYRTAVIDGDPQGSGSILMGFEPEEIETSLYNLMFAPRNRVVSDDEVRAALQPVYAEGCLDVLCSNADMEDMELELSNMEGGGMALFAEFLDRHKAVFNNYDVILIDSNPWTPKMALTFSFAADCLMVPVDLEGLSIRSLSSFVRKFEARYSNKFLRPHKNTRLLLVPNRLEQSRPERLENLAILTKRYPQLMAPLFVPENKVFLRQGRVARNESRPLAELDIRTPGADALTQLAHYLEREFIH